MASRSSAAKCITTLTLAATLAATASAGGIPSDTPQYRCYIEMNDRTRSLIWFYSPSGLPQRFNDATTVARAEIPSSLRPRIHRVIECAREDLKLHDVAARELERTLPQ